MESITQKELLIKKKQQLAVLEMQLQNSDKPNKKSGYSLLMFILGVAIIVGGGVGVGNFALIFLGLILIIAGIIRGIRRSTYNKNAQKNMDDLSFRIIGVKHTIIELENS